MKGITCKAEAIKEVVLVKIFLDAYPEVSPDLFLLIVFSALGTVLHKDIPI